MWAQDRPPSPDDETRKQTSRSLYVDGSVKKSWIGIISKSTTIMVMFIIAQILIIMLTNRNLTLQSHIAKLETDKQELFSRVKRSEIDANGQFCPTDNHKLDMIRRFTGEYYYQLIDGNAHTFDWFHISASDFSNDIHIGFSNGCKSHHDEKWEIVLGGWSGTRHVIRDGNQSPKYGLVKRESCSDQFCTDDARTNRYLIFI